MSAYSERLGDRTLYRTDDRDDRVARVRRAETHVKVLAGIHLFLAFGLVALAVGLAAVIGGAGLLSGDLEAILVTSGVGTIVGFVLLAVAAPGLLAGFGLLGHRRWARALALIIAVVHLPGIPFGTLFGVYSFWILLHEDSAPLFDRRERY